jgi:hypothetical protein
MAIFRITSSGTFNLKQGAGFIRSISVPAAGTSWTLQINDGPRTDGTTNTLYGATPGAITVNLGLLTPLNFGYGCQIVTSGTAGELDIDVV